MDDKVRAIAFETYIQNIIQGDLIAALYRQLPNGAELFEDRRSWMDREIHTLDFTEVPGFLEAYETHIQRLSDIINGPHPTPPMR